MSTCLATLATMPSPWCLSPSDAPCAEEPVAEQAEVFCEQSLEHPGVPGMEKGAAMARPCSKGLWKRKAPAAFPRAGKGPR